MHVVFDNLSMHTFIGDRACQVDDGPNHKQSFRLDFRLSPADSNLVLELVQQLKLDLLKLLQEGQSDPKDAIGGPDTFAVLL